MIRKKLLKAPSKGFSLIEISITILIIGIILAFGIKGYSLLEQTNSNALVNQINQYKIAVQLFSESEGRLPGFNADNIFDSKSFWQELIDKNLIDAELINDSPRTKLGGIIQATSDNQKIILTIPMLTPKQAYNLDRKIDTGVPTRGNVRSEGQNCISGDTYNKDICDDKCCLTKIYL